MRNITRAASNSIFHDFISISISAPKGFTNMSNLGNNNSAPISAANIAAPVNKPKIILGVKFDNVRIQNPQIMIREV
jgi:hypothetical protein